ncbi:UNVERIFIED_CONTAM: hypothetical protein HDU68_000517 [Siphonaria sp. JEL0065]|nr:hypothetical protein HDU68_000517 [Siphonaria sp. JEL0065]
MTPTWHPLLVKAVLQILNTIPESNPISAEKTLKKTLRSSQNSLSNAERKTLARKFYGVISLRSRLSYILETTLPNDSLSQEARVIALITIYTITQEPTLFPDDPSEPWLPYATTNLPTSIMETLTSPSLLAITTWPTSHSDFLSTYHSLPTWLTSQITSSKSFPTPESQLSLASSLNTPSTPIFRICLSLTNNSQVRLQQDLETLYGIKTERTRLSKEAGLRVVGGRKPEILGNSVHQEGRFEVQDEGSQVISLAALGSSCLAGGVCAVDSDAFRVVDLCCGRGGKALHLLDLMNLRAQESQQDGVGGDRSGTKSGVLICHDVDLVTLGQAKVRIEKSRVYRDGNVEVGFVCSRLGREEKVNGGRGGDMLTFPQSLDGIGGGNDVGGRIDMESIKSALGEELADVVLVDAPCSSLGTLRRGPNVRWEMNPKSLDVFPPLQRGILSQAVDLVRPGGVLVYATCTFNNAECVDIQQWFTETYSDLFIPGPLSQVFDLDVMERLFLDLSSDDLKTVHSIQLSPSVHDTDAFYIARWIRK